MEEKISILLVDDNRNNLYALAALLDRPDYHLVSVTSGKEALASLLRQDFAVILLDVMMPEMDGFSVATAIRGRQKNRYIPIIFVTAVAKDLEQIYEGYSVGAVDYIQKPLEPVIVRAKVSVFVDLFRKDKQLERQAQLILNSERAQFLEQLQKAERKYRGLVNALDHAIIWESNPDLSSFSFVSKRSEQLLGYRQEQWFDELNFFLNHVPQSDHPSVLKCIERVSQYPAKDGLGERCEHRLIALDRKEHWFHTGIQVERDAHGKILNLRGLTVDIHAMKDVEQALRDSEERLDLALRSAKMGIWDWNLLTGSLIWSDTLKRLWAYDPGEFSGTAEGFWSRIHPDDKVKVENSIAHAFDSSDDYQAEYRVVWPDGSEHWVYARGQAFRDRASRVVRMSGIAIEITERKRVEEALRESEERYRTVVEGIQNHAIIRLSLEGNIQDWNHVAQKFFGYNAREVLGKNVSTIFIEENRKLKVPQRTLQGAFENGSSIYENWNIRKDGSQIFIRGTINAIKKDKKVMGYVAVMSDETQRKNVEEERELLVKELHQAVQSRDEMVSVVAHDLKNPLTAISLSSALLLKFADKEGNQQVKKHAERIKGAAERALKFTQDILDLSKIDAGRTQIDAQSEDAEKILSEMVELFQPIAEEKKIELKLELEPHLSGILCDYERLMQAVSNLVGNAIKFTPAAGVIAIRAKSLGQNILFSITDNGPGILPDEIPHIFDRYWQSKDTSKKGIGLGLHIAKWIIESHQGKIWVESKRGQGTTFFFTIPMSSLTKSISESLSI